MHDPERYLAKAKDLTSDEIAQFEAHAQFIKTIAIKKAGVKPTPKDEELSRLVEGGPKTAELPDPDIIPSEQLLDEINFSDQLTSEQCKCLENVILKHELAFGLEGRLGNHDAKVQIKLKPSTKEISLAPYSALPAKKEVIDKQLDEWIRLEVIEPSKSPWGFPVIVVYHNGKPRLAMGRR